MARVCEGECMEHSQEDEPLTLMRWQNCGLPQLYEALEEWKCLWPSLQLKGHKEDNFCFLLSSALFLFYCSSFHDMMSADPAIARGSV